MQADLHKADTGFLMMWLKLKTRVGIEASQCEIIQSSLSISRSVSAFQAPYKQLGSESKLQQENIWGSSQLDLHVLGVSNKARIKPVSSATETS